MDRVLTEVGGLRDEIRVQGAMIVRLDAMVVRSDGRQAAFLEEMRAMRSQITRMNDRIRKLEDADNPPTAPT